MLTTLTGKGEQFKLLVCIQFVKILVSGNFVSCCFVYRTLCCGVFIWLSWWFHTCSPGWSSAYRNIHSVAWQLGSGLGTGWSEMKTTYICFHILPYLVGTGIFEFIFYLSIFLQGIQGDCRGKHIILTSLFLRRQCHKYITVRRTSTFIWYCTQENADWTINSQHITVTFPVWFGRGLFQEFEGLGSTQ